MRATRSVHVTELLFQNDEPPIGSLRAGIEVKMLELLADDPAGHRVDVKSQHVTGAAVGLS